MKSKRGERGKALAILVAALVTPATVRAAEPAAASEADESQPAAPTAESPAAPEAASEADEGQPAAPTAESPAAPEAAAAASHIPTEDQPAVGTPAVAPPPPAKQEDAATAENIADLQQLSLADLLAVPVWKVTTASKREESSATAPATVFVITKEDIYLRGYSNLVDVLKDLPGMEITEYIYALIGTQVAVRGVVGNNKVIVLVNGVRVNPPGGDPLPLRSDYSIREAEQIEVIYGPGSTLYGQDAISAVINIKTKKTGGEHWIDIGAGAGYPWRQEGWLGLNRKLGEAEINGYVQYSAANLTNRKDEFPDEYATYGQYYALTDQGAAILDDPKRWDRGLNGFLQLQSGNFSTQVWHRQSWRNSGEGRGGMIPAVPDNKWSDVATVADAKYLFKLAENVSLSSALTFNRYQILPESVFILPIMMSSGWIVDHKYAMETSVHLEETVSAKIGRYVSLLGGFAYGHYDIMPMGTVPANLNTSADISSQAGTIDYYTTPGDPSSKVSINKINNPVYQSVGIYAEGTVKIHERVRALVGMRIDKDERYDEIPLSPRAALIVNPLPELALKAIYTQAFVAPPPYNMFDVFAPGYQINTTNLDLKPEKARSFELNAEFRRESLLTSLSGFYNIQSDLLIGPGGVLTDASQISSAVYASPDGGPALPLTHDANSGRNRVYGCDVFGRYSLLRNLASVWGSYSYVDSEMENIYQGQEVKTGLPGLSHHNIRAGASFNIIRDKLFANLGFWLRSNPRNVTSFTPSAFSFGVSTLQGASEWPYELSANLIYRIAVGIEAFATLKNATNHHYASIYDSGAYPGETFRGIAGLRFRN
jgi:outer membrane cobalamin receptor